MYEIGSHLDHSVTLSSEERRRHLYLIGRTGTGKSTLLQNLMRQDIQSGRGFVLIDPHGDLVTAIADNVPPVRMRDVVYFDPLDKQLHFNPLSHFPPAQIVSAFKHVRKDFFSLPYWGLQSNALLSNALRLLTMRDNKTLLDFQRYSQTPTIDQSSSKRQPTKRSSTIGRHLRRRAQRREPKSRAHSQHHAGVCDRSHSPKSRRTQKQFRSTRDDEQSQNPPLQLLEADGRRRCTPPRRFHRHGFLSSSDNAKGAHRLHFVR